MSTPTAAAIQTAQTADHHRANLGPADVTLADALDSEYLEGRCLSCGHVEGLHDGARCLGRNHDEVRRGNRGCPCDGFACLPEPEGADRWEREGRAEMYATLLGGEFYG